MLDYQDDEGKVEFFEGNFAEYEEYKKRTLGATALEPKRIVQAYCEVMRKMPMRRERLIRPTKPAISIRCKTVGLIRRGKRRIRH